MSTYWRIISFAKPLGKYAIPYFLYTIIYAAFNALIFMLLMPIVNTLFDPSTELQAVTQAPQASVSMDYLEQLLRYWLYRFFGAEYDVMNVLVFLAVIFVICAFISNLFRYLGQKLVENLKINTIQKIRDTVYAKVMNLNLGFFSNERKGDIMSKITSDVQLIRFTVASTLQVLMREPFLIIFYVLGMVMISWELTIFSAIYLPLVTFAIGTILKRLRRSAKESQESFGEMTSVLDESLSGAKVIKAYNAEDYFTDKFAKVNRRYSRINKRIARRQQLASPMSEFLGITAAAGLLIFGGSLTINGTLSPGGFVAYLGIFTQITRPVRAFAEAFANINQGIAAGDRVLGLLDIENPVTDKPDAAVLEDFRDEIEFRDVRFSYESREVISGVSFSIKKGETVALVGPSGGGKSTLSDLVPRFYDVTAGEILVDGKNIKDYRLSSLRSHMGIVSQETVLFNDTIENNIRLGNEGATHEEVMAAARVANADGFICETDLGYDTNIGDRGAKLSGGQRQRLSIARAVLKDPDILILDEATSALDTESEKLVQDALNSLLRGRTSIVIAHRLSTIHNADKILVVEEGRITEQGTHKELMARKGTYAKLIEMQQLS